LRGYVAVAGQSGLIKDSGGTFIRKAASTVDLARAMTRIAAISTAP
jgi:hypothetical protein